MSKWSHLPRYVLPAAVFFTASVAVFRFDGTTLWRGVEAVNPASAAPREYDLTQLSIASEVVRLVRDKYIDPKRVKPREMLIAALNHVQRDVAQVIVVHEDGAPTVRVRVDTQEREFRVDNVVGPWDLTARLHDVFVFLQDNLKGTEVELRDIEYAACNGMLRTLDPHSVLLTPEAALDMTSSTKGQFGGLGIVISIRDQELTVMNPMPGTPAGRAGIRRYDRITRIDNESTMNMGMQEALEHLRGGPGSKVTIWVRRDGEGGWTEPKPFELTREIIKVKSVESRRLEGGIGYVRLKQFQQTTLSELDAALLEMRKAGPLKGLVLDLRGNPGGLLDQAARVVDRFVESGPLVATVGNAREGRDVKMARAEGTEPNYPLALLVNGSSASASEIVAGSLKNHDRALVIGQTTFGKGSVQLVFDEMPNKTALKLTIAQYLTEPGDISIQGTGVTPDVELDPMTADLLEMDLSVDSSGVRERDLSRSLSNVRVREGQLPSEVVRFHFPQQERQALRERGGELDDQFEMDFSIRFARDLLARAASGTRTAQLAASREFVAQTRGSELAKVSADLSKLGIDWSDAPSEAAPGGAPDVEVKLETNRPGNRVLAGEPIELVLSVTNRGKEPLYRLSASTQSDSYLFDKKELVIGKLEPGKTTVVRAPLGYCDVQGRKIGSTAVLPKDTPRECLIPKDVSTRSDFVNLRFEEARGRAPSPQQAQITVDALPRPQFAYSFQFADNRAGNGDGRLQKGEQITMYVAVKNVGAGRSYDTQVSLKNLSGAGVMLHKGRFDVSNMQPGEQREVEFTFDVQPELAANEVKLELAVLDRDLRASAGEKLRLPITVPAKLSPMQKNLAPARGDSVALFESPEPGARQVAVLRGAAPAIAQSGEFAKLAWGGGRFAFARSKELAERAGTPSVSASFDRESPRLEVEPLPLSVRGASVSLRGVLSDNQTLLDGYVFVGSRKVFYQSNRGGKDAARMAFATEVPLRPGVNVITVVGRESADASSRRTFVVRRDGPNGEYLATPKTEESLDEASAAE